MTTLITGGAGFIGLNFVKHCLQQGHTDIHVLDKCTYASHPNELQLLDVPLSLIDLADKSAIEKLFTDIKVTDIIHFAAESHVDNSIKDSTPFVLSNVVGTVNLLDAAVKHRCKRFVHISTDEVFGEVYWPDKFTEQSPIEPKNPYSASKAAAEHFVIAYGNTHKLPWVMVNSSNNYGPWQNREKLIPKIISNAVSGIKVPVYGRGQQIRDWIYVGDTCRAIWEIWKRGRVASRYCVGGGSEIRNIDLVTKILANLGAPAGLIEYVADRPGHDQRYATDTAKLEGELGWKPQVDLNTGINLTIKWYLENENRL